jgi:hypothetical protein
VLRVRATAELGVAVDQGARVERGEQPLVRVDDEGVGVLDAGETVPRAGRQHAGQAVGAVDVQPDIGSHDRAGDVGDVVDDAEVGRPRGRDHGEDAVAVLVERRAHRVAAQYAVLTDRHADDLDVHHAGRRGDRGMRLDAADHAPRVGAGLSGIREPIACGLAGGDQGREVAERAALHEDAPGARRQTELVRQPAQHLVLGVHGAGARVRRPGDRR